MGEAFKVQRGGSDKFLIKKQTMILNVKPSTLYNNGIENIRIDGYTVLGMQKVVFTSTKSLYLNSNNYNHFYISSDYVRINLTFAGFEDFAQLIIDFYVIYMKNPVRLGIDTSSEGRLTINKTCTANTPTEL